jgi:hypothetical protein
MARPFTCLPGCAMVRSAFVAVIVFAVAGPVRAQPVLLAEKSAPGDLGRVTLELELKGNLFVAQNKEKVPIPLEAKARHTFVERVMAVADGLPLSSARHYAEASATATVGGEKSERGLPADRRVIVARRNPDGLLCFAPTGTLARDDLDLVTEHFNPQCLAGLLPGKAVNVGDTWTVTDSVAQSACLFEAVIKTQLTGKLTAVKDGVATCTIDGTAEGVENGAKVTLTISATCTFETTAGRVTALTWKQKDAREQGPVSPASQVEATVTLKRVALTEVPKELADDVLAKVPAGDVPAAMTDVRYTDPKGRYTIVHPRDWHVTGQTDSHLVMRLMDRGEFAAQATVSAWRKVDAGKHSAADEFKKAIADAPGWVPAKVLSDGEVPVDAGRWLYRVVAEGKMDGSPVVQSFYLLAGPQGDQVAVTMTMRPEKVRAVGTRDAALVTAIEFKKK